MSLCFLASLSLPHTATQSGYLTLCQSILNTDENITLLKKNTIQKQNNSTRKFEIKKWNITVDIILLMCIYFSIFNR